MRGAIPDGRYAGETLADANASPIRGTDKNGPLAVFKSAMKIDQSKYQGFLMNMKFHPSALKTKEDMKKLGDAIKVYFKHGGSMIQLKVVSSKVLRNAQQNPDEYRDLMVRVAGYSTYFVDLTRNIQDEIVEHTEHNF